MDVAVVVERVADRVLDVRVRARRRHLRVRVREQEEDVRRRRALDRQLAAAQALAWSAESRARPRSSPLDVQQLRRRVHVPDHEFVNLGFVAPQYFELRVSTTCDVVE